MIDIDIEDPSTPIRAVVVGWPVDHSKSPAIMNAAFEATGIRARMGRVAAAPEHFDKMIAWLRTQPALFGASITVPYKLRFAELCGELSPDARAIGAINCVQIGDTWIGHNTDAPGFSDALAAAGFDHLGKRAVVLGAGGAARGVCHGLAGAAAIDVIARRPGEGQLPWTAAQLAASFARADLVVDCTSTGLEEASDVAFAAALPIDQLPPRAWIATLIYHRRTALLQRASARGHSTLDGRGMLVHQAARAFTIWTGEPAPLQIMTHALDAALVKNT